MNRRGKRLVIKKGSCQYPVGPLGRLLVVLLIAQNFCFCKGERVCVAEQKTTVSVTGGAGLQYYTVIMARNFAKRARISRGGSPVRWTLS